jgi:fructoselysine-6-P-deglycase FrlB-like protein
MSNPGPASTSTIHPSNLATNQAIRLLASASAVPISQTGDSSVTLAINNTTSYAVTNVAITNANKDVSSGALAIWTGAAGTGTEIVTNAALTSNTGATYVTNSTVVSATKNVNLSAQTLYVKVGTAVAGGTVDIFVYGYDFSEF